MRHYSLLRCSCFGASGIQRNFYGWLSIFARFICSSSYSSLANKKNIAITPRLRCVANNTPMLSNPHAIKWRTQEHHRSSFSLIYPYDWYSRTSVVPVIQLLSRDVPRPRGSRPGKRLFPKISARFLVAKWHIEMDLLFIYGSQVFCRVWILFTLQFYRGQGDFIHVAHQILWAWIADLQFFQKLEFNRIKASANDLLLPIVDQQNEGLPSLSSSLKVCTETTGIENLFSAFMKISQSLENWKSGMIDWFD